MAGASSGWVKTEAGGVKGKAFLSVAGIKAWYGNPSMSSTEVATIKRELASAPAAAAEIAKLSIQPTGQAQQRAATITASRPLRTQVDMRELDVRLLAETRTKVTNYTSPVVKKRIAKLSDADLQKKLQDVIADFTKSAEVAMRVPSDVLGTILDTSFLNQHATNTSRGDLDQITRMQAEWQLNGIPFNSSPDAYPIYGYLAAPNTPLFEDNGAEYYGDVRIIFKDVVRDRTSFTVGDSLYPAKAGSLMASSPDAPDLASIDGFGLNIIRLSDGFTKPIATRDIMKMGGYLEAQIYGPTTAADIAKINFSYNPSPAIQEKLAALNIAWTVGDTA
jgi:hypothetical protein